jgi:hypothetical protein
MSSKKANRQKIAVRVMALILAGIMVLGVAYYLIILIAGN